MTKESKINIIATIILAGFAVAIFYHYIMGSCLGLGYPYNTFLFIPNDRFMDLFNSISIAKDFTPYIPKAGLEPAVYFPFTYIILYLFSIIPQNLRLIALLLPFISTIVFFNYKYLKTETTDKITLFKNVFIFSFLSFPVLFVVDRANIEALVFIFTLLFIYFYIKKDSAKSVIFISLAASIKLYPLIFIVLFFKDRKYKELFYSLLLLFLLTFISLLSFNGGLITNIVGQLIGLNYFTNTYAIQNAGISNGSSLFSIIKIFSLTLFPALKISSLLKIFTGLATLLLAGVTHFVIKRENTLWKQVAMLVFAIILLAPVSFNYKLIYLFIPLWLFLNCSGKLSYDKYYAVLWGLLLIPKEYFLPLGVFQSISLSVFLNPLLIIIFTCLIIKENSIKMDHNIESRS